MGIVFASQMLKLLRYWKHGLWRRYVAASGYRECEAGVGRLAEDLARNLPRKYLPHK